MKVAMEQYFLVVLSRENNLDYSLSVPYIKLHKVPGTDCWVCGWNPPKADCVTITMKAT